jgi:acetyltransferase-like isoleucine patch superfamily enzyme
MKLFAKLKKKSSIQHNESQPDIVETGNAEVEKYEVIGENNKLFLLDNGKETEVGFEKIEHVNLIIHGNNNIVKIPNPETNARPFNINLSVFGNNNFASVGESLGGNWNITEYFDNNILTVGKNTACGDFSVSLHSNECHIGCDCMFSSEIDLWTDGHSVIDAKTREVLNVPTTPIIIGDHVWIGRGVKLTKGAQIPKDCIVGFGSVVTKKFTEENCVIAGNPAKVVKTGINWNGLNPVAYKQKFDNGEI